MFLVPRGNCTFGTKAKNAHKTKASAILIINNEPVSNICHCHVFILIIDNMDMNGGVYAINIMFITYMT